MLIQESGYCIPPLLFSIVDSGLTILILVSLALIVLLGCHKDVKGTFFFGKTYSKSLKGLCAMVVIMVHIPNQYGNPIQIAIGSFGFVAVTLFFMFSAYGMQYSNDNNPAYLKSFWRNRISSLLIPSIIVNFFHFFCLIIGQGLSGKERNTQDALLWLSLVHVDHYVIVLLEYCLWFFLIVYFLKKSNRWRRGLVDGLLIAGVAISSLWIYLRSCYATSSPDFKWCFERWGLIWGILLYRFFSPFCAWLRKNNTLKIIIIIGVCLILGVSYLKYKTIWFWGEWLLKIILGFNLILLLCLISKEWSFGNAVSRFLGEISFEMYLSHGICLQIVMFFFPSLHSGPFLLLSIGLTILVSWLLHSVSAPLVRFCRK